MKATYLVSGLLIDSEMPLESLQQAQREEHGAQRFRFRLASAPVMPITTWLFERTFESESSPWLSVARLGNRYLLRLHGRADFVLDPQGAEITCRPEPGCPMQQVEHMLADMILPQLLHLQGQPSFHASAVLLEPGRVIGLLGPSGSGKSTLAATLGETYGVVSDDCLAVRLDTPEVTALPSYPSVRLRHDSAEALEASAGRGKTPRKAAPVAGTPKLRVPMPPGAGSLVLRGLYLLEPTDTEPQVIGLSRRDSVVALARHLDRLDPNDHERLTQELDMLVALAGRVRVARLQFRHRYEDLPGVCAALREDQTTASTEQGADSPTPDTD